MNKPWFRGGRPSASLDVFHLLWETSLFLALPGDDPEGRFRFLLHIRALCLFKLEMCESHLQFLPLFPACLRTWDSFFTFVEDFYCTCLRDALKKKCYLDSCMCSYFVVDSLWIFWTKVIGSRTLHQKETSNICTSHLAHFLKHYANLANWNQANQALALQTLYCNRSTRWLFLFRFTCSVTEAKQLSVGSVRLLPPAVRER